MEKGPFVQGSTISMATLDSKLNATGKNYSATISDDAGTFSFGSQEFDSPYARLTATGYFYNEVTGKLSNGTLTLSALVDLSDKQSVNVNLLTHLKAMRIQKLISCDGKSFKEASAQAQTEILKCFGYESYAGKDVSQFSITAGTDEAAALIIISSQIQIGRSEAQITEFVSKLAVDFAEDGLFSETNKSIIQSGVNSLFNKLDGIAQGIVNRYSTVGVFVTVKDLKTYVDWDGDGETGNEFLKPGEKVTLSKDTLEVPAEGGSYTIDINSPIPVFVEKPVSNSSGNTTGVSSPEVYYGTLYADGDQDADPIGKQINGKQLSIIVCPSKTKREYKRNVELYAFDGSVVATIEVTQAGADSLELVGLGEAGSLAFSGVLQGFTQVMAMANDGDRYYTLRASHPQMKAPLDPSYSDLKSIWSNYYQFINRLTTFRSAELARRGIYKEFLDIYSAIAYYNMVVCWGGVPYITEPVSGVDCYFPRETQDNIFASLIENLKAAIVYAEDKVNVPVATKMDDALLLSKDVARIALADIYMYQGKYSDARPLLKAIIDSGHYQLDAVIFGSQYSLIYCYSDVILSFGECEFKINGGNSGINFVNYILSMLDLPSATDVMEGIKTARKTLDLPGYFAFLKRSGIAKDEVGYEDYQLLWPIPESEITGNPLMSQNAGY